jgi:hypothetical protein
MSCMATLPFVVEPRRKPIIERIGSEESGIIEIERRGYLTTGEKSFVQQVQQLDDSATEIVTLSRQVARRHSLGMDKAYNMVLGIISGATLLEEDQALGADIEQEFAKELTAVVRGLAISQSREELVLAACMIRYRVNSDFEIEEISKVHPDIISGLAKLYRDEDKRSVEAFTADNDQVQGGVASVEEGEKKPVKATKSRSRNTTGD